jgi:hypothetical protein
VAGDTLTREPGGTVVYRQASGYQIRFDMNEGPLQVIKRSAELRAALTKFPGIQFEQVVNAYIPADFNSYRDLEHYFLGFFDLVPENLNVTYQWMGGTIRRISANQAIYNYNNQDYNIFRNNGPLNAILRFESVRAGWMMDHNTSFIGAGGEVVIIPGIDITAQSSAAVTGLVWSGTNSVTLKWDSLGPLGSGDIRVDLRYQRGEAGEQRRGHRGRRRGPVGTTGHLDVQPDLLVGRGGRRYAASRGTTTAAAHSAASA